MSEPSPRLGPDAPIEFVAGRVLFRAPSDTSVRHRTMASLVRLDSGRLLLAFRLGTGPGRRNDGAIMLSRSDDDGASWDEPVPIYAWPGWDCLPLGGLMRYSDDLIVFAIGRLTMDLSLPGEEPVTDWYLTTVESRDGGDTWSEPGPEIRLFPAWSELYGASNPHRLSDGRSMLACIGTLGRDTGWQAGVTFTDAHGRGFTPPVIVAAAPDRDFSDTDVVRLDDGRFLSVSREHVVRDSMFSHSADEGRTWSPIRPTGFRGSNVKLYRLRSGAILCAYRDEDPARRGVSCSVSDDGGATWRFGGQLYAVDATAGHRPGTVCGYPDMVSLGGDAIACVLHTYPDERGNADLYFLRLRDRSDA